MPRAPVARTPSTGCGSIASTASANSFARMPVVCTHSASTPAKGPSPTATTNSIANTNSLMLRQTSIIRRTGRATHHGATLPAHSRPHGTAHSTASPVPQMAICTVSTISPT